MVLGGGQIVYRLLSNHSEIDYEISTGYQGTRFHFLNCTYTYGTLITQTNLIFYAKNNCIYVETGLTQPLTLGIRLC